MDRSYLTLAAKYVRRQAKQLAGQVEGVSGADDIEFIHRARVATRRLRAAMRMFGECFGRKQVKRWRKDIRRVTRELGAARDRDVQIAFLCEALGRQNEAAACRGIARLLARSEQQRDELQPRVLKAVKRLKSSGTLEGMLSATHRVLRKVNAEAVGLGSEVAYRETGRHVREHLNELFSYQDSLNDSEDDQRHHAMRIAAKRLRYTLEISNPVYDKQLNEVIEAVKQLQTLLGEIHDCDVWQDHLSQFAAEERGYVAECYGTERPFVHLEPGIGRLREDRLARRRLLFAELVAYWAELQRQRLWDRLAQLLERSQAESALGRQAATEDDKVNGDQRSPDGRTPERLALPIRPQGEPTEEPPRRPHRSPRAAVREMISR